eukprot:2907064-Rhodomonas_salina.1
MSCHYDEIIFALVNTGDRADTDTDTQTHRHTDTHQWLYCRGTYARIYTHLISLQRHTQRDTPQYRSDYGTTPSLVLRSLCTYTLVAIRYAHQ